MEHLSYKGENQKVIERFLVFIYSLYALTMVYLADRQNWYNWAANVVVVCFVAIWIVFLGKYKTYRFRAYFSAIMMQVCVFIYAIHLESFSRAFPVFIIFVVLYGLYGFEKIISVTTVSAIGIFIYFGLVKDKLFLQLSDVTMEMISQFVNILLLEYVIYVWTKRNCICTR